MKLLRWAPFVCALSLMNIASMAQPPKSDRASDSLWGIWSAASEPDSVRLTALNKFITIRFLNSDPDSTILYSNLLFDAAGKKGLKKQMAAASILQGRGHVGRSELPQALERFRAALELYEAVGDLKGASVALNNMALSESELGDATRAIEHMTRSLKISEELKDSSMMARTLGNIGVIYVSQRDTANAMDYYQRRLVIAEALGQKDILAEVLSNMAQIQGEGKRYEQALALCERSIAVSREIGYPRNEVYCLFGLSYLRYHQGDLPGALAYDLAALELAQKIGDHALEGEGCTAIASDYQAMGALEQALAYGQRSMALAREGWNAYNVRDAAQILYEVQKARGRVGEALDMHELYITMRDSILNDENKKAIMSQRFTYDYDKKEALLQAEQEKKDAVAAEELRRKNLQRNAFIGGFGLMILLAGTFLFQRNRISKEKARSEELLLNILPEEVAEELKAKGEADAKQIDQVTVLFTDFKGFTAMSEILSPKELVRDIHECFSAFDRITEKHGIEKIKTIGDAYMAAGGLPTPNTTHALDVVKAALEIRDFIAEGKARKIAAGLPYFEVRIGIHTGPVVAGIVGVKKFAYDIWGDTVNTASRMESSGQVGEVNVSEATYELVKNASTPLGAPAFGFTPRGKVQAKGKGEMEMYFVAQA